MAATRMSQRRISVGVRWLAKSETAGNLFSPIPRSSTPSQTPCRGQLEGGFEISADLVGHHGDPQLTASAMRRIASADRTNPSAGGGRS